MSGTGTDLATFLQTNYSGITNQVSQQLGGGINYATLGAAWDMAQNQLLSIGSRDEQTVLNIAIDIVRQACISLLNQQSYQQPNMYQPQMQPMYHQQLRPGAGFVQGMLNTCTKPNVDLYKDTPSQSSSPMGGSTMSPDVLKAANTGRGIPISNKTIPNAKLATNTKVNHSETNIVNPPAYKLTEEDEDVIIDAEPTPVAKRKIALKELSMAELKSKKNEVEISLPSDKDKISKVLYTSGGIDIATLYRGKIESAGFKDVCGLNEFLKSNAINCVGNWYTHVEYIKLHSLKIPHTEGAKQLKAIKDCIDKKDSVRVQLVKILDVINASTKLTGDSIDRFIVGLINKYTCRYYLEFGETYGEIEFDSIEEIIGVLGSAEPKHHVGLWESSVIKDRLSELAGKIVNKLSNMSIYDIHNATDVPFIMTAIGSYTTEDHIALRSIEEALTSKNLATGAKKTAETKDLQNDPCYGEIKKYMVVGLDEVAVISNCELNGFYSADDTEQIHLTVGLFEVGTNIDMTNNVFDKFFNAFSVNSVFCDLLIYPKFNIGVQYITFIAENSKGENVIRLVY